MANASGPDISFYQDNPTTPQRIDFVKMKQQADFVIIRAGQNLWVDRDFQHNWAEARRVGLPRGSYWFYDSRVNPSKQAEKYVETLGNDLGELPLFLDLEENYGGPYAGWQHWYTCLERLKTLVGGKEIGIYTAYFYWTTHAPGTPANLQYFRQYPLWIAHYQVLQPRIPAPWTEWLFWQYTDKADGAAYGVESREIDMNYFNGDGEAFRRRFNLQPIQNQYRIDLSIRDGAGPTFSVLGQLQADDTIERLETAGEWMRVRRTSDGLIGWTLQNFQVLVESPPTPPPPAPPSEPSPAPHRWYRVNVGVLNLRQGPGMNHEIIGKLYMNEIVEGVLVSADGQWLQLRRSNGMEGWASLEYLAPTSAPTPPPILSTWYRVNTTSLRVRKEPSETAQVVGGLVQGQIVESRQTTSDGAWAHIRRFDGLVGWCSTAYLTNLGGTPPEKLSFSLFPGVTYYRRTTTTPRHIVAHLLVIDMRAGKRQFLVTPPSHSSGILCSRKTTQFLREYGMDIAINGDAFRYLDPAAYPPQTFCPNGGEPVEVYSYAASRGTVYSRRIPDRPILYISPSNEMRFDTPTSTIYNAISGDRYLVFRGSVPANLEDQSIEPRTALGLSQNGRYLILAVVDGRQPGYSEGMTFPELGKLLLEHGAYMAINLDGGGSSVMVIRGISGEPFILNSPIEEGIPGNERSVANHLGLRVR